MVGMAFCERDRGAVIETEEGLGRECEWVGNVGEEDAGDKDELLDDVIKGEFWLDSKAEFWLDCTTEFWGE